MGNLFRHNAHKVAIILVIACFLYIFVLLMLYFLVFFTAVLMVWMKFGTYIHFGYCICNFYVIYQIIIYIF